MNCKRSLGTLLLKSARCSKSCVSTPVSVFHRYHWTYSRNGIGTVIIVVHRADKSGVPGLLGAVGVGVAGVCCCSQHDESIFRKLLYDNSDPKKNYACLHLVSHNVT